MQYSLAIHNRGAPLSQEGVLNGATGMYVPLMLISKKAFKFIILASVPDSIPIKS